MTPSCRCHLRKADIVPLCSQSLSLAKLDIEAGTSIDFVLSFCPLTEVLVQVKLCQCNTSHVCLTSGRVLCPDMRCSTMVLASLRRSAELL